MEKEGVGAKVRVVRCPKCERLLPEFTNFSVYRCGGCDATLQAIGPIQASEASPVKGGGENATSLEISESAVLDANKSVQDGRSSLQKSDNESPEVLESGVENMHVALDAKMAVQASGASISTSHEGSLTSIKDSGEHCVCVAAFETDQGDKDRNRREKLGDGIFSVDFEDSSASKESSTLASNGILREDVGRFDTRISFQNGIMSSHLSSNEIELAKGNVIEGVESQKSTHIPCKAQQMCNNSEWRNTKSGPSCGSSQQAPYDDEGPSKCVRGYLHGNGECDNRQNKDGAGKVGCIEQNQAELLRMLDQLRDQVQRSCDVSDKHNASGPVDRRMTCSSSYVHHGADLFPESSSLNRNPSKRSSALHDQNTNILSSYPNVLARSNIPSYSDPPVHRGASFYLGECPHRQVDNYINGHFDPDPIMPYHHEGFYHQSACSCFHCYQRQFPAPTCGSATIIGQQRVPYVVNNHEFYPVNGPSLLGPRSTNSRIGNASLPALEQQACHQTIFDKKIGLHCRPVAGAAPFTVCFNCSELLQLPERSLPPIGSQFNLRCGSCSKVLPVERKGNRLISPAPEPDSHALFENNVNSFDSPGNTIHSIDEKLVLPYTFSSVDQDMLEKENYLILSKLKKTSLSSSSTTSEDTVSPDSVLSQKDIPTSSEMPYEAHVISRVSSLPLREHFEYSSSDETDDKSGHGSRSRHANQERTKSLSGNFMQNSTTMVQVATEMDVPEDEYPPAGFSQDSWDMIMKEDKQVQMKVVKANDSFLTGFIKKSLRFNQTMGNGRYKISINGHPIPDRLSKKAEKLAGPIYPGDYWYDYRAGFWGVIGHPCLGIIPPFIEEFNYPMPKNCAGGNTAILVNGRELHEKDLQLLVNRGLPDTRGCSYIIDISGKVWDESTGEELDSLGKLAPTVVRMKRGFGMRYPRSIS